MKEQPDSKEYLSTGEVAALCSVTSDAVLKWIKAGKLKAVRTPGGHYRIAYKTIQSNPTTAACFKEGGHLRSKLLFCWEYHSKTDVVPVNCRRCLVYRSRARRCYELSHLSSEAGHKKVFCTTSCDHCRYYYTVQKFISQQ